eukprot:TRINITY_DN581_c0_g1_i3.p1 TRINITY_DN581_c0_g1~~TRINITY_DN581_c0_g1_i3.p1  ORF type:complete len:330 (-),score=85.39 TRINITY_DN581_c0_g1_i3:123-1067(-)
MGKGGFLKIHFDKPYFHSGELLSGRVTMTIEQSGVKGSEMKLKLKGFEKTYMENTVREDDNTHTDVYKDDKTFFRETIPLADFRTFPEIPPGTWDYPFRFQLPSNLPSVYSRDLKEWDGDDVKAAIVYKAKAFIDMPGSDIKEKTHFIISEPVTKEIKEIKEEKHKSFTFARKKLYLTVKIEKNVFVPGEIFKVHVSVNNESGKNVDFIKIKLQEDLKVQALSFKKNYNRELYREKWDGVESKTKKDFVFDFKIKSDIQPSTHGHLISCDYHLDIECDVPWAGDLEVHPKIVVALLPSAYSPYVPTYQGGWFRH